MFGRIFPASAHSVSALILTSPSAGFLRTASPARTPSTLAPLIIRRLVFASPMPPVKSDDQQPCAPVDAAHRVLEHLAADGIEHHVRALPVGDALDGVAERLAVVANEMIGAPSLRNRKLLVARRGGDHGSAQHLADFDGGQPDAAARAMHQQHLAGLKPAAIDQRVIGGTVAGQKRRALGIVEIRRQPHELRRRGDRFIGIGAVPHLDDHPVTHRDARRVVDPVRRHRRPLPCPA